MDFDFLIPLLMMFTLLAGLIFALRQREEDQGSAARPHALGVEHGDRRLRAPCREARRARVIPTALWIDPLPRIAR